MAEMNQWGDMNRSSNLLGKQMLLARRLVEAAAASSPSWMPAGTCTPTTTAPQHGRHALAGHQVDHAVAAFLEDVEARGLSDKILLVVTGEMGRTPRIGGNGGRDHWANLTPLLMAGGGLKMGQVIGQSDRQGGTPATDRYTPRHLLGTVMETLFNIGELRLAANMPREVVNAATAGTIIRELF